jgi:D-amino-acid oxidase
MQQTTQNLRLSEDISAAPKPLQEPTATSPRVLVIGGGVIGLTTAWLLLDRGVKVTVLSKEWASEHARLSSQAAGALWKCPPLECGPQAVMANLPSNKKWALESYKVYSALAAIPESCVELRPCTVVTTGGIDENKILSDKVDWIQQSGISGFRRDAGLLNEYNINPEGLTEAYEYTAPVINTDLAMSFLMDLVKAKGAQLRTGAVEGDLLEQESQLLKEYQVDAIINATGLGAGEAAADSEVYGLHGALLRVINDGTDFPVVKNAMIVCSSIPGSGGGDGAFLLPRKDGILALGTISKPNGRPEDLTVDSAEVKEMKKRCEDLLPWLKAARLDPEYPIIQGTRPQRRGGARVERETRRSGSHIVHSYGHGGAGWSLAFGSARDAISLVGDILSRATWSPWSSIPGEIWEEKDVATKMEGFNQKSTVLFGEA